VGGQIGPDLRQTKIRAGRSRPFVSLAVQSRTIGDRCGQGTDVTDALDTGDLDLSSVATHGELAARLKTVHVEADQPSLRELERRTRHGKTPLSRTTVSKMLKGGRLPRKTDMLAFLEACGIQNDQMDRWRLAWERVAKLEYGLTERPAVLTAAAETPEIAELQERISQLKAENNRLRLKLGKIGRLSIWNFVDNSAITLVSYQLPSHLRPPQADSGNLNYVRLSGFADLDTLIEIYGEIRTYNPASEVSIKAAQDLTGKDVMNHVVLIGGLTWKTVIPYFSRTFLIPIQAEDPAVRDAIVIRDPDGKEREFKCRFAGDELVEDVGFFARGKNPAEPQRSLTICGGITTRGVQGAAMCFIEPAKRERNERYLIPRFPDGSTYCIVMRVPIVNQDALTPDLSEKDNRLFEWCDAALRPGRDSHAEC
jgi:hypothetical protein